MELVFVALTIVLAFAALDAVVLYFGVDSRPRIADDKGRPTSQRWI